MHHPMNKEHGAQLSPLMTVNLVTLFLVFPFQPKLPNQRRTNIAIFKVHISHRGRPPPLSIPAGSPYSPALSMMKDVTTDRDVA